MLYSIFFLLFIQNTVPKYLGSKNLNAIFLLFVDNDFSRRINVSQLFLVMPVEMFFLSSLEISLLYNMDRYRIKRGLAVYKNAHFKMRNFMFLSYVWLAVVSLHQLNNS